MPLAALLAGNWAASLYEGHAEQQRQQLALSTVALQANRLATRLAPWRGSSWQGQARSLVAISDSGAALDAARRALRLAPGDGRAWRDHARLLARLGHFGPELMDATQRAHDLRPNSRATRMAFAIDAVRYWRLGDKSLRGLWKEDIEFALHADAMRFIRYLTHNRREVQFCATAGVELELGQLCALLVKYRSACSKPSLNERQLNGCARLGFRSRTP